MQIYHAYRNRLVLKLLARIEQNSPNLSNDNEARVHSTIKPCATSHCEWLWMGRASLDKMMNIYRSIATQKLISSKHHPITNNVLKSSGFLHANKFSSNWNSQVALFPFALLNLTIFSSASAVSRISSSKSSFKKKELLVHNYEYGCWIKKKSHQIVGKKKQPKK